MVGGNRKSIRLKGYDYSQPGYYFITICVHGGRPLLGRIVGSGLIASPAGLMAKSTWFGLPERFPAARNDSFILMPNHCHGILVLEPQESANATTLGSVIGAFKSVTTNLYCHGVAEQNWPRFDGRLWQRNYFERIIRNEQELNEIRRYIYENPARWYADRFNPDATAVDKFARELGDP